MEVLGGWTWLKIDKVVERKQINNISFRRRRSSLTQVKGVVGLSAAMFLRALTFCRTFLMEGSTWNIVLRTAYLYFIQTGVVWWTWHYSWVHLVTSDSKNAKQQIFRQRNMPQTPPLHWLRICLEIPFPKDINVQFSLKHYKNAKVSPRWHKTSLFQVTSEGFCRYLLQNFLFD